MFEDLFSRSGLSLDRLRSFLAFAQAGSIAKAAPGDLNLQSQISRQISELETFFSTELTLRNGKTLALTPAGQRLANLIQEQLQDLADFQREQSQQAKSYVIGSSVSVMDWLILPALPQLRACLGHCVLRLDTQRSRTLVEGVRDGRIDFAIVREDAIPSEAKRLPVRQLTLHLCVPKALLTGRKKSQQDLSSAAVWQSLPFTAGRDGGQLDAIIRQSMAEAGVKFQPAIECNSMLQAHQLIAAGHCAGILPSIGLHGLPQSEILIQPFPPLKHYRRELVLHYNERQMRRRAVDPSAIQALAARLREGSP
jgi:DNA-binding transcriptional LysR family regulator